MWGLETFYINTGCGQRAGQTCCVTHRKNIIQLKLMKTILLLLVVGMVSTAPSDKVGRLINQVFSPPRSLDDECECVIYYQCHNGTILLNGMALLEPRIGSCDGYLDVCCKKSLIKPSTTPQTTQSTVPAISSPASCGIRNPDGVGFHILSARDENKAQFAEFPWMAAVLSNHSNGEHIYPYQCGGSLIHPRVVLTAAHCIGNSTNLIVRLGEWDTQTTKEPLPHQDRSVVRTVVHPNFKADVLYNDVALLILDSPVNLTANVGPICLPQSTDVFDGSRCFAAGWGKDIFGRKGRYQAILKKIELPIVNFSTCQDFLRDTRLGKHFVLDRSFICAGGEGGHDTCRGDGGSPLFCPLAADPARYVQAGIVSWGIGCGDLNIPGVYVNVAGAREWIDQQLQNYTL